MKCRCPQCDKSELTTAYQQLCNSSPHCPDTDSLLTMLRARRANACLCNSLLWPRHFGIISVWANHSDSGEAPSCVTTQFPSPTVVFPNHTSHSDTLLCLLLMELTSGGSNALQLLTLHGASFFDFRSSFPLACHTCLSTRVQ